MQNIKNSLLEQKIHEKNIDFNNLYNNNINYLKKLNNFERKINKTLIKELNAFIDSLHNKSTKKKILFDNQIFINDNIKNIIFLNNTLIKIKNYKNTIKNLIDKGNSYFE